MKSFKSKIQLGMNYGNVNLTGDDHTVLNKFAHFEKDTQELRQMIKEIESMTGEKLNTLQ